MEYGARQVTIDEASYPVAVLRDPADRLNEGPLSRIADIGRSAAAGLGAGVEKISDLVEGVRSRKINRAAGSVATCECVACECSPCTCGNSSCNCS